MTLNLSHSAGMMTNNGMATPEFRDDLHVQTLTGPLDSLAWKHPAELNLR